MSKIDIPIKPFDLKEAQKDISKVRIINNYNSEFIIGIKNLMLIPEWTSRTRKEDVIKVLDKCDVLYTFNLKGIDTEGINRLCLIETPITVEYDLYKQDIVTSLKNIIYFTPKNDYETDSFSNYLGSIAIDLYSDNNFDVRKIKK